ncbi:MAG: polyprenol monophosphomannose synthase [Deltaproteobacteria bacterium]|nr:polyprenol monophosphomannose synthase [Deltaproteobacteria bacterium]
MPFLKPLIVLPTYNECENILQMIPALFALSVPNLCVLVVDDSSPDGTQELIKELQKKYPNLSLLSRPKKEGLGRAYVDGFRRAIEMDADCIIQMDADFSHDPADVPKLLEALETADWVIGSRYIVGGGTKHWPLHRLMLSQCANVYASFVTAIPISDLTGGFKAWKSDCLQKIGFENMETNGYGFQIETNFRAYKMGFKPKEVPILFTERRQGKSKMSQKIVWEALLLVWKLRFGC